MDIVLKGFLQGSIPVVVFVGGAHHLTKKFKASKPVLYYGSLLAGLGLAYAVVEGKIKAPFMNAETEHECDYDCTCAHDEGFCAFDCIHCKDEKNAETFGASTFEEYSSLFEIKIPADSYDVGPDAQLRKWIRSMKQKGYSYIMRKQNVHNFTDEEGNRFNLNTPEYLIYDIKDEHEITYDMERDLKRVDDLMIYGSEKAERVFINYDGTMRGYGYVKPAIGAISEYIPVMDYEAFEKKFEAETFEARENKDGTIVLTENEWDSCLYLYNGNYLYGNKELKLIDEGLKSGVKFEKVQIHSQDALKMIRLYENLLRKRR